jgi:hypothetical protein
MISILAVNADGFDLRAFPALVAERGHEGYLHRPYDRATGFDDDKLLMRVAFNLSKSIVVGLRQRLLIFFAAASEQVICQEADDFTHVVNGRAANLDVRMFDLILHFART